MVGAAARALGRGGDRGRRADRTPASTAEELIAHCRERLAGYETPEGVVFADALPETVGGKVLKYKLRAAHGHLFDDARV